MLRFTSRVEQPMDQAAMAALRPYGDVLAALLCARGIRTAAQAETFLHPAPAQLHDPLLLHDMPAALDLLAHARAEALPTVVYGDYDVDGMCATALLTDALRRFGIPATPHVPLRSEGYGLNLASVEALAAQYRLLVTVDLGITNADEVRRAQALGMRVIVTDHHQLGLTPCPADAVINPLLDDYPFPRLCGTGVAFKLAQALLGADEAARYLDLAALATVADIVPLLGENRALVALGLPRMRARAGLRALLDVAGCQGEPDSDTLGFQLGPRLNAAGRLADANDGVRLLLTEDDAEAAELARQLDLGNRERKRLEGETLALAREQAARNDFIERPMLIVRGEGWHAGVIGLVAGRLTQQYHVPSCVLSEQDGLLHGSLRSVRGVNIHQCLQACDDLLLRYGGHEQAAGVTLAAERYPVFCDRLNAAVRDAAPEDAFLPEAEVDLELPLSSATDALADALERLRPFGFGNPAPVFWTAGARLERRRACGALGAHLQLTFRQGDRVMDGIAFGMGPLATALPDAVDAAYALRRDEYMGRRTLKCEVKALRPADASARETFARVSPEREQTALLSALCENRAPREGTARSYGESFTITAPFSPDALAEWLRGRQGTLLVARARDTALAVLPMCGGRAEPLTGAADDPRCFHALLLHPEVARVDGHYRTIVLLDGPLTDAEPARWHELAPNARVIVCPVTDALRALAATLDAGDECYRALYRLLRQSPSGGLSALAQGAGLTEPQTLAGLCAFQALGLIDYVEKPFSYTVRAPRKCSLSDGFPLDALRALQRKEV